MICAPGRETWLDELIFFLSNQTFNLPGGRVLDFDREFAEKHKRIMVMNGAEESISKISAGARWALKEARKE